jgi:DNA-binding NtrC family response regulator
MVHTALLTSAPPGQASMPEIECLMRCFDIRTQTIPFADCLHWPMEGVLTVMIAVDRGPVRHLFFWDPRFRELLHTPQDASGLYDTLLCGCVDFLTWPCRHDEFASRIRRLKDLSVAPRGVDDSAAAARSYRELGLAGESDAFRNALRLTEKFASYEVPVLLEGETGTGKELCARALHYLGPRRRQPFVPVNCGALPDTLIENELFGHASGAYTGARGAMEGVVAQAEGGTLFFDEVHCLSPKGQATLLRFAQDLNYRPLGASSTPRRANVRLVAATNQCLWDCVGAGGFREDLYYRLNVGYVRLPPLRERRQDIPLLVDELVQKLCTRYGTEPRRFDPVSLAWLSGQPWKGNVRELENVVQRAFMLSERSIIRIDPLRVTGETMGGSSGVGSGACFKDARLRALTRFEGDYLRNMLAATTGNVTEAARLAGKDRRVFGRLMKKHGIDRREFVRD